MLFLRKVNAARNSESDFSDTCFRKHAAPFLVLIPCILLYVHKRPTNALILFKFYYLSYLLLHVSASMSSSGSLHVPTELLVPSESLLIKFCMMDGDGF
jgi:hypothetical protein